MKIGLVCPYDMFRGGGVQEYVMALRDGIVARGHKAYIITPQPRTYKGPKVPGIIMVGGATPIKASKTYFDISVSVDVEKLEKILEEQNFDILHFHEPAVPILSRQILSRSDAINIATFHAATPSLGRKRAIETVGLAYGKSILKYFDVLTAVSIPATGYVKSITKRKVYIIPNGIDLSKYKHIDQKNLSENKRILYIGRLEKRKAVKKLIEAFALLHHWHKNYQLDIVGDGPERARLEDYVRQEKIGNVNFLGFVDEAKKIKLLQESEVFCSPAMYGESFGIVLLEAMASGCVVVCGNNPGYESVMTGSGQLSIVNPKDTREFARRLLLMASDHGLRQHWFEWANSEVIKYDYLNIVDQYLKLYKAAYDQHHKSS
jgi:phosphatidyl-myo-inositol alpha-mannosyltransferase